MEIIIILLLVINLLLSLANNRAINLRPIHTYNDEHVEKQTDFIVREIRNFKP